MKMNWQTDVLTKIAAKDYPVDIPRDKARQYSGRNFDVATWNHRIREQDEFPAQPLTSSPEKIIEAFCKQQYLPALALVVSWGTMWRGPQYIYRKSRQDMHDVLHKCSQSIQEKQSIEHAWRMLTTELGWSAVITSKTLHFMCRSLGFTQNPPVAIDNRVIREKVWREFKNNILLGKGQLPCPWNGHCFEAYSRYMTAILEWAGVKCWTTTDVEVTLFKKNYDKLCTAGR